MGVVRGGARGMMILSEKDRFLNRFESKSDELIHKKNRGIKDRFSSLYLPYKYKSILWKTKRTP